MNTIEISKKLVELCKQGKNMDALDILSRKVWKPLQCLVCSRK